MFVSNEEELYTSREYLLKKLQNIQHAYSTLTNDELQDDKLEKIVKFLELQLKHDERADKIIEKILDSLSK
jgi:hypothetical protein